MSTQDLHTTAHTHGTHDIQNVQRTGGPLADRWIHKMWSITQNMTWPLKENEALICATV